jgi:hypothetical protein
MIRTDGFSELPQVAGEPGSAVKTWTILDELVIEVHGVSGRLPEAERTTLGRAMREAAVSAAVVLMSGASGDGPELGEAAKRALGALVPLRYQFYLARRLNLIDVRRYKLLCLRYERASSALRALAALPVAASAGSPRPARSL